MYVARLPGGKPSTVSDLYDQTSPIELLPLGVPQVFIHGTRDPIVPVEQSRKYAGQRPQERGHARDLLPKGAGHFDVIAPFSPVWPTVEEAVRSLLDE